METSMSNGIKVVKRNGETEKLNLDKIHVMVEHACKGLAGVSESQVEMNAGLQFFDGNLVFTILVEDGPNILHT